MQAAKPTTFVYVVVRQVIAFWSLWAHFCLHFLSSIKSGRGAIISRICMPNTRVAIYVFLAQ